MKLGIYDEAKIVERPVILRLSRFVCSGAVELKAVNERGERLIRGDILVILPNGTIKMAEQVDPDLGFQLDKDGKVKLA